MHDEAICENSSLFVTYYYNFFHHFFIIIFKIFFYQHEKIIWMKVFRKYFLIEFHSWWATKARLEGKIESQINSVFHGIRFTSLCKLAPGCKPIRRKAKPIAIRCSRDPIFVSLRRLFACINHCCDLVFHHVFISHLGCSIYTGLTVWWGEEISFSKEWSKSDSQCLWHVLHRFQTVRVTNKRS